MRVRDVQAPPLPGIYSLTDRLRAALVGDGGQQNQRVAQMRGAKSGEQNARAGNATKSISTDSDRDGASQENALKIRRSTNAGRRSSKNKTLSSVLFWGQLLMFAGIGVVLAKLFYAIFSPIGIPEPEALASNLPQNEPSAQVEATGLNPFKVPGGAPAEQGPTEAMAPAEALEETSLDLVLHGVQVDGSFVTAVIRTPDGKQRSFTIDDEIWNGVRLDSAREDQVTIRRGEIRETLTMVNREVRPVRAERSSAPPPEAKAPTEDTSSVVGSIGDHIEAMPRPVPGGIDIVLFPRGDGEVFRSVGLTEGDVLISINGRSLPKSPEQIAAALSGLQSGNAFDVVVDRNGIEVPLSITVAASEKR
ncbi:MAG: type II secretion system protein N [Pseudomonadota bacterium]